MHAVGALLVALLFPLHAWAATITLRVTTGSDWLAGSSYTFTPTVHSSSASCTATSISDPDGDDVNTVTASCSFAAADISQVRIPNMGSNAWQVAKMELQINGAWMLLWAVNLSPPAFETWIDDDGGSPEHATGIWEMLPLRMHFTTQSITNAGSGATFTPSFISTSSATCAGTSIAAPAQGASYWSVAGCWALSTLARVEITAPSSDSWEVQKASIDRGGGTLEQWVATNQAPPSLTPIIDDDDLTEYKKAVLQAPNIKVRIVTAATPASADSLHTYSPKFISKTSVVCDGSRVVAPGLGSSILSLGVCSFPPEDLERVEISQQGNDGWDISELYVEVASVEQQWWAINESPPARSTVVDGDGATRHLKAIFAIFFTPAPATPAPATPAPPTAQPTLSPATPAPSTPAPSTPAPATSAPATPAPATPAPLSPAPATPAPVTPAPATPAPLTPAPATSAPATPAPATPAPLSPAPATPAPVTPAPSTSAPDTPAPDTTIPDTPAPPTAAPPPTSQSTVPVTMGPTTPSPPTPAPLTPVPSTLGPVPWTPVELLVRRGRSELSSEAIQEGEGERVEWELLGGLGLRCSGCLVEVEVRWKEGGARCGDGSAQQCKGGACIVVETDRSPSHNNDGLAGTVVRTCGAVKGQLETYESTSNNNNNDNNSSDLNNNNNNNNNNKITLSIADEGFRAYSPMSEKLKVHVSREVFGEEAWEELCSDPMRRIGEGLVCWCSGGGGNNDNGNGEKATTPPVVFADGGCVAEYMIQAQVPELPNKDQLEAVSTIGVGSILVTSALAPVSVGAGGGVMRVSLLTKGMLCPSDGPTKLDRLVNPFQLRIGDDPRVREVNGAVVGGILLQFAFILLGTLCVLYVYVKIKDEDDEGEGEGEGKGKEGGFGEGGLRRLERDGLTATYLAARGRFGWLLIPAVFMYGGAVMSCSAALLYSSTLFKVLGGADLALFGVGLPVFAFRASLRVKGHAHVEPFINHNNEDKKQQQQQQQQQKRLRWLLWGSSEWVVHNDFLDESWQELHRLVYDGYKEYARSFLGQELLFTCLLGMVEAYEPSTPHQCRVKGVLVCVLFGLFLLLLLVFRPYLAPYENAAEAGIVGLEFTMACFILVALGEERPTEHWSALWAGNLAITVINLIVLKFLVDLAIFLYDEREVWAYKGGKGLFLVHLLCCGNRMLHDDKEWASGVTPDLRRGKKKERGTMEDNINNNYNYNNNNNYDNEGYRGLLLEETEQKQQHGKAGFSAGGDPTTPFTQLGDLDGFLPVSNPLRHWEGQDSGNGSRGSGVDSPPSPMSDFSRYRPPYQPHYGIAWEGVVREKA